MRRLSRILAIILILFSTIGVTVTRHYCGDILKTIAVNYQPNCCGGEEMPEGCCHNEAEHLALDENIQIEIFDFKINLPTVSTITDIFTINRELLRQEDDIERSRFAFKTHPPAESDIYIMIQSLLI